MKQSLQHQTVLGSLGINPARVFSNCTPDELTQQTIERGQGKQTPTGALAVNTGKFTGRSPKDKYTVKDSITEKAVDWGAVNIPMLPEVFDKLFSKSIAYLGGKELWIRDAYVCAHPQHRINLRVINDTPWANLFCQELFLRPEETEQDKFTHEWLVMQVPGFEADPEQDGTRQRNFTAVNFTKKIVLIAGSGYTGEMKKGMFSVLNFLMPHENILPMHCSANEGNNGDVALFFGLSGTGKTTLSADPNRALIGDDEHGWADDAVFNFEGGCYAKVINLTEENEPEIFRAIRTNALLENVVMDANNIPDYTNDSITENTRVAYPIDYIPNAKSPSRGNPPQNIFFLTCDAYGVLPPISKLTAEQAMYHFLLGYTAKVAGTEMGVTEPQVTFSACFGKVFLPRHPSEYAKLLGDKLKKNPEINVWLVNTGWSGGAYGVGQRIRLRYTRAMINAALDGTLAKEPFVREQLFGLSIPQSCPNVPEQILNPRNTWSDKNAYDHKAMELGHMFASQYELYAGCVDKEVAVAGAGVLEQV